VRLKLLDIHVSREINQFLNYFLPLHVGTCYISFNFVEFLHNCDVFLDLVKKVHLFN